MLLLPVSQEDSVVRRVPWVSLSLLAACVAVQAHACAVEPGLELQAAVVLEDLAELEEQILSEHRKPAPNARGPSGVTLLDQLAQATDPHAAAAAAEQEQQLRAKLRAGELTSARDPRFARYEEIRAALAALEAQLPAQRLGYRPAESSLRSMLTSLFTHAGWLHLIGNMWFLYLVGCNLEDRWGRLPFLSFYLLAGCVAALAFRALHRDSNEPLVGASGAVAGAMGAFMICYASTRVKIFYAYVLLTPRWGTFRAPAWLVLGLWVGQQVWMTLVEASAGTQVAYSAHAGGFAFGAVVALIVKLTGLDTALDHASKQAAESEDEIWREHPLYERALEERDRGDFSAARETALELLADAPLHLGAHEVLLDAGLELATSHGDFRALDRALPFLIEQYHRSKSDERLVALYKQLRQRQPTCGLSDQELLRIATAASHRKEGVLVVTAVSEMLQDHPASALLPRALLLAADAQAAGQATELRRATLERLIAMFPEHACAKLARDLLTRSEA